MRATTLLCKIEFLSCNVQGYYTKFYGNCWGDSLWVDGIIALQV